MGVVGELATGRNAFRLSFGFASYPFCVRGAGLLLQGPAKPVLL